MNNNFLEVVQHIHDYFEEHLPLYTVYEVHRQSCNLADDYLFMVSAVKEDGTYAVWTSWNEGIRSLNCGHYNLPSTEACTKIMTDYQNGSLYNERSTPLKVLKELLIKSDDNFMESYHEFLYIKGFAAGIIAQRENNWDKILDAEVNILLEKVIVE